MSEKYSSLKRWIVPAILISFSSMLHAQISIVPGGVLNSASFDKTGTGVAPGSLITIFGTGLGAAQADADKVPFEVLPAGQTNGTVDLAVAFGGNLTVQSVKIAPAAPGVFTIPSGAGNA